MEEELERFQVRFATGNAMSVRHRRSFRDRERNDIEPDLPGWPPGKRFAVRGRWRQVGRVVVTVTLKVLLLPFIIILDALGQFPGPVEKRGKLEERENEIDDFPVMWAGVGETARTLPWQLDPSRRPADTRIQIELAEAAGLVRITSHERKVEGREIVTVPESEAVLWTVSRADITGAAVKTFSVGQVDFTVSFRDGSWARLAAESSFDARRIVDILNGVRLDVGEQADAEPPAPPK